jgi:uncharacterized phiE125 gp8 family phage protein
MANAIDLTTLANVKAWLGLSNNNTDDGLLDRLITSASNLIIELLDRGLKTQTYTNEVHHGSGTTGLCLRQYPVSAVASVSIDEIVYTTGFTFDDRIVYLSDKVFTSGKANIKVTYTAGYASVPFGIEQACVELVGVIYREKERIGHISKQLGGETVTFNVADLPSRIKTSLHQWMNVVPS